MLGGRGGAKALTIFKYFYLLMKILIFPLPNYISRSLTRRDLINIGCAEVSLCLSSYAYDNYRI